MSDSPRFKSIDEMHNFEKNVKDYIKLTKDRKFEPNFLKNLEEKKKAAKVSQPPKTKTTPTFNIKTTESKEAGNSSTSRTSSKSRKVVKSSANLSKPQSSRSSMSTTSKASPKGKTNKNQVSFAETIGDAADTSIKKEDIDRKFDDHLKEINNADKDIEEARQRILADIKFFEKEYFVKVENLEEKVKKADSDRLKTKTTAEKKIETVQDNFNKILQKAVSARSDSRRFLNTPLGK